MTVAMQSLYDAPVVFHANCLPTQYLGIIDKQYYMADIGLCKLAPGTEFSNPTYFDANPPKRLVDTAYVTANFDHTTWFEVDGFTCGKVSLLDEGPRVPFGDLPVEFSDMDPVSINREYAFLFFGTDEPTVRAGICGGPVVHEPSDDPDLDGVAIGFFFMNAGGKCYVPHCDRVLADGWS